MQSKLSNFLDKLSVILNKVCKKCHARKKIRAECKFIGFRNNRFNYRCKECNEAIEAIKKFSNLLKFRNGDLENFFLLFFFVFSSPFFFVFIPMNIWITRENLMKLQYRQKKLFTAN